LIFLARHPPATHRKNLADETIGSLTAKIGGKRRVFLRAHQPTQWHLPFEPFLEARIGLNLGREVGGVLHEVLRDGIDLNVVRRLPLDFFLKTRIGLNFGGEIRWVFNKVLRDSIDLNVV